MSRFLYHAIWTAGMVALLVTSNTLLKIGQDGTTEHWVCLGNAFDCMAPSDVTPGAWWAGTFGTILLMVAMFCVWPWIYFRPRPLPAKAQQR
jgi:hypothetical protein